QPSAGGPPGAGAGGRVAQPVRRRVVVPAGEGLADAARGRTGHQLRRAGGPAPAAARQCQRGRGRVAEHRMSVARTTVAWSIREVARTGSTNADVATAARAGAPEGLVLVADEQVAGRGRLGRTW